MNGPWVVKKGRIMKLGRKGKGERESEGRWYRKERKGEKKEKREREERERAGSELRIVKVKRERAIARGW